MKNGIESLANQIKDIKRIAPNWEGYDDIYIGLSIVHGYYKDHIAFSSNNVRDNIKSIIGNKKSIQLVTSTWTLPEDMSVQFKDYKCKFVTI